MNEVSSSVSLFPSLSLTLTGGPVGLTAKLAAGNAYDEQIERLKQIKKNWAKRQGCFVFFVFLWLCFLLRWVKALICCHISSIQVSRKLRLTFFYPSLCTLCNYFYCVIMSDFFVVFLFCLQLRSDLDRHN